MYFLLRKQLKETKDPDFCPYFIVQIYFLLNNTESDTGISQLLSSRVFVSFLPF